MPSPEVVLALRDVAKDYHGLRPLRVRALELHAEESIALVGFDRVAAEVLVNLVTGAALPDSGDVVAFGTSTKSINDARAWLAAMDRFGILSERVALLEAFSLEQNLALPFSLEIDSIPADVQTQVRRLADEVGIEEAEMARPVGALGAEVLQRARLAKAIALGPRLLLAEHPNAALSPAHTSGFAADLAAIVRRRRMAMVVMTADHAFARAVSDRVLIVRPATGELTPRRGWLDGLARY